MLFECTSLLFVFSLDHKCKKKGERLLLFAGYLTGVKHCHSLVSAAFTSNESLESSVPVFLCKTEASLLHFVSKSL